MLRKIVFSVLVLASIALIGFYLYDQSTAVKIQDVKLSSPIPSDAVGMIEMGEALHSWHDLKSGNLLYEELLNADVITAFDSSWSVIDSIFLQNPKYRDFFIDKAVTYSLHPQGKDFDFLVSSNIGKSLTQETFEEKINEVVPDLIWNQKSYEGAIIQIISNGESTNYAAIYNSYFLWSPSSIILEKAIRTVNNGNSIIRNKDYSDIKKTASIDKNIHAYLNYNALPEISSKYITHLDNRLLGHIIGGWAELDVGAKPNSILLNGLMICHDSLNYFLHCFDGQETNDISLTEIMPNNIAWYMHANISDNKKYLSNSLNYWQKNGNVRSWQARIEDVIEQYGWAPYELQQIEFEELALSIIEPKKDLLSENYCVFVKLDNEDRVSQLLDEMFSAFSDVNTEAIKLEYRSFETWSIGSSDIVETCFGPLFFMIDQPVFSIVEDYLLVSNSLKINKSVINKYLSDQTLSTDIHYTNFMSQAANESNLSFYSNIARSPYYYKNIIDGSADDFIENNLDVFRQFQAVSLQFEKAKGNKYYQTFYCKYNPVYKNETSSLWELSLDTSLYNQPTPVVNHNNKQTELLVQDERNDLYLISNTGKLLWKKKFEERIIGQPVQVDRYQNDKLQMLFLTENMIHLLDRNGKVVEGFPIPLESKATSDMALMDYDNNARFRILIGCENGLVYNYDILGQQVEGWEYQMANNSIVGGFEHFKIGSKDFILHRTSMGSVKVINRKGETRYEVSDSLVLKGDYMLVERKNVDNTGILHVDTLGLVRLTSFDGFSTPIVETVFENVLFHKSKKSSRMVAQDNKTFTVFNDKGELISEFDVKDALQDVQVHEDDRSGKIYLSATSSDELVFLYSEEGVLQNGFPLTGTGRRIMGNINKDDYYDFILGTNSGTLYTYTLDF
ncbi:MAG: hypothetical protein ACI8XB_000986 [Patiriisocius sp.]|jgi:hypothetical protein